MSVSTGLHSATRLLLPALAVLALAACSDGSERGSTGDPSADDAASVRRADADRVQQTATATRDDVIAALRCHAVLSSAMASRIVLGKDGSAVVGIREQTRWFTEAKRRAAAAGLGDEAFRTLMAETRVPMTTPEQQAENRPLMEECLADLPPR